MVTFNLPNFGTTKVFYHFWEHGYSRLRVVIGSEDPIPLLRH